MPDRAVDEKQTESASNSEAMKLLQSNPSPAAELALKKLQSEEGLSSTQRLQYLWIRGAGLSLSEKHTEALTALDEAAGMARQRSATKVLRMIVRYAAASAYELGQYDRGKALAEEGLAISARLGDTSKFTLNLHNELALNEAALGNLDTAIRHFRIAEQMATSTNDFKTRLKILSNLSQALDRARQHDEAIRLALQVIEEASPMQHGLVLATTRLNLADMYFRRGQSGDAKTMVNSALGEMPLRGSEKLHAQADAILGRIAIREQRLSEGQELLKKARGRFEMLGDKVAVLSIDQELSVLTSSVSVDDQIEDLKKRISE